jgi:hypothetical protein
MGKHSKTHKTQAANLLQNLSNMTKRCEVSERAMHRLSPHGPCEPSARVMGRARTYATDLPKRDSMLPEAASERDQHSPHHPHHLPRELAPALIMTHGFSMLSYNATFGIHLQRTSAPHTTRTVFVATRHLPTGYDRSWRMDNLPLVFVPGRSPMPDGPTACLTPTHQTRQRISRHSPSPLHTMHRLAEGTQPVSPPS